MTTTIIGFPRIGEHRELKFITEKYFRNEIPQEELLLAAKELRAKHWNIVKEAGITEIPSNDFSHYDNVLDAAVLFNIVPKAVQELDLTDLEKYFALARGYQGEKGDVRARPMKKWFNTNYHYIVPAIEKDTEIKLAGHKIFDEFQEAKDLGITTRPVLIGPFTLLQLTDFEEGVKAEDVADSLVAAYGQVFAKLAELGAEKIQLDEPSLVKDLTAEEKALFLNIYQTLLADKKGLQVLIQTYFGDVRDIYTELTSLPVDAIGLDFVEGKETAALVATGFPADKTLYAGIVNGKNIWRNNYEKSLAVLDAIPAENVVITTSCSLLHVPFTTANEEFEPAILNHFAFAVEKLSELRDLDAIRNGQGEVALTANKELFALERVGRDTALADRLANLTDADYTRLPVFAEREAIQREKLNLPLLPTTTIGSFPQTKEIRSTRLAFRKGNISTDLISFIKEEAPHFDIIGACYPEVHPESPNSVSDIKNLKKKVDAGCSTLVTQLFFDNEAFYNFQEKCSLADIEVPIIAGIMPIINRNQALRLLKTCENIHLPRKFKTILEKYEHNPESLRAAGLAYAVDQIVDLVTNDVASIHLYTMNNAETARTIHQATHSLFKHYS
ncbi:hypothetical protein HPA08_07375 [Streptococcus suis]|nr:hypothetical protein [Streptococcus suis]